uniref:Uncharacterized protein n=1 Tax=Meloidogyne incognita TaxID=6306 RepID=A0A914MBN9_MELIC
MHVKESPLIDILFVFVFVITAFCNLSIELTIIILHPILHSQLKKLLRGLPRKFFKIYSAKVYAIEMSPNIKKGPLTMDGSILIIEESELRKKHFEVLKRSWSL